MIAKPSWRSGKIRKINYLFRKKIVSITFIIFKKKNSQWLAMNAIHKYGEASLWFPLKKTKQNLTGKSVSLSWPQWPLLMKIIRSKDQFICMATEGKKNIQMILLG